ncbi:MAG TPA: LLM class flavin-dependent oxidoreductase [Kofleriaceae bacterium]
MKFSLFFEMQLAAADATSEAQMFRDCVAQAELAEATGYHAVWAVEHHGLYEYAHSAAPEVFLSFVAARTKRLRIGHGVTLLPHRYNHPIRIAERIATLDILSEGRVNWGTGKSSSLVEQVAFETDRATLHEQWLEAVEIIPRMWREEVFSYKGKFFDIAPTRIVPKPVQKPHPPIFVACSTPKATEDVGKLGFGALNFSFGNESETRSKVDAYRRGLDAAPADRHKAPWFACAPVSLVLDDDLEACRYGLRGARFFTEGLRRYYAGTQRPDGHLPPLPTDDLDEDVVEAWAGDRNTPDATLSSIVGDPVSARETVSRFAKLGVDELILIMQLGTLPHEMIMRSIRTFAERVMPHFS